MIINMKTIWLHCSIFLNGKGFWFPILMLNNLIFHISPHSPFHLLINYDGSAVFHHKILEDSKNRGKVKRYSKNTELPKTPEAKDVCTSLLK